MRLCKLGSGILPAWSLHTQASHTLLGHGFEWQANQQAHLSAHEEDGQVPTPGSQSGEVWESPCH